jgi:hypothetical protein
MEFDGNDSGSWSLEGAGVSCIEYSYSCTTLLVAMAKCILCNIHANTIGYNTHNSGCV